MTKSFLTSPYRTNPPILYSVLVGSLERFMVGLNLRRDLFLGDVKLSGSIALIFTLTNTVDLVVARGTMMVTILTGTSDGPLDVGWMPGTNTSNLSQTLVRLARKLRGSPSAGDTLESMTLGDGDDIDHLIFLENGVDLNGLLE